MSIAKNIFLLLLTHDILSITFNDVTISEGVQAFTLLDSSTITSSTTSTRNQRAFTSTTSYFSSPLDDAFSNSEDDADGGEQKQQPKLGIELGKILQPLTPGQEAEVISEATEVINDAFASQEQEMEELKEKMKEEFEASKEELDNQSELRAKRATGNFLSKADKMAEEFLESTLQSRMGTKMAAMADANMEGKGLELGSWGTIGGNAVLASSDGFLMDMDMDGSTAATTNSQNDAEGDIIERQNRILIIYDPSENPRMQEVLNRFTTLIEKQFPSSPPIEITTYKPTSKIPLGGDNAQCAIIVASSLSNGRQSAESITSRLLQRTVSPGAGGIGTPPTHLIVLSSLGTERTDKFPYSMQNTFGGGKLTKQREVEEVVMSTVTGRMVVEGGRKTRDYTIIKLGEIVDDSKVKKKGGVDNSFVDISPGDSLDGNIGVKAAANVLLQAVAIQPNARNATMSAIGSIKSSETEDSAIDEFIWEDSFLRLDGPELWRMEAEDVWIDDNQSSGKDGEVDLVFQELSNYLTEWSLLFDNGAKGTGLTTPVTITPSKFSPTPSLSVRAKWGVRLEFKQTSTGSSYLSKDEERELERERQTPSDVSSNKEPPKIKNTKQKKEGGVEILVEKTISKDGIAGIRVRATRCNMSDFTVIKELSEETIVKKVQGAIVTWKKQLGR